MDSQGIDLVELLVTIYLVSSQCVVQVQQAWSLDEGNSIPTRNSINCQCMAGSYQSAHCNHSWVHGSPHCVIWLTLMSPPEASSCTGTVSPLLPIGFLGKELLLFIKEYLLLGSVYCFQQISIIPHTPVPTQANCTPVFSIHSLLTNHLYCCCISTLFTHTHRHTLWLCIRTWCCIHLPTKRKVSHLLTFALDIPLSLCLLTIPALSLSTTVSWYCSNLQTRLSHITDQLQSVCVSCLFCCSRLFADVFVCSLGVFSSVRGGLTLFCTRTNTRYALSGVCMYCGIIPSKYL